MKHTYNNWSYKIFEGFYESNLYNSDSLYWITQTDKEEGYLKDNQYYDIDNWESFTKEIAENAINELSNILPDNEIIQDMKLKDIYRPKYYNFETDSLIIDIKLNLTKLKKYCFTTHREDFNKYLKENFTSYDGFISFISNNINDFILDYNQKPNNKELNTMIEYYLLSQIYGSTSNNDFIGFDTSYHYRLYEDVNEIQYEHLKVMEDTPINAENELVF